MTKMGSRVGKKSLTVLDYEACIKYTKYLTIQQRHKDEKNNEIRFYEIDLLIAS